MANQVRKPLEWVASSRRDMQDMPDDVKDVFGAALLDAQYGDQPAGAKAFGEGLSHDILKLVDDFDGDTYRAAYTVAFPKAVYVLDVFKKKSKEGKETPKLIKDRVAKRFTLARNHYRQHYDLEGD